MFLDLKNLLVNSKVFPAFLSHLLRVSGVFRRSFVVLLERG